MLEMRRHGPPSLPGSVAPWQGPRTHRSSVRYRRPRPHRSFQAHEMLIMETLIFSGRELPAEGKKTHFHFPLRLIEG